MALHKYEKGGPAWGWESCAVAYDCMQQGIDYPKVFKAPPNFEENMEFYLDVTKRDVADPFIAKKWGPKYNAACMWNDMNAGGNRWFLEAYLLLELPDEEIAARMAEEHKEVITEYRSLFFDLSRRTSHPWMVKYIWEPAHTRDDRVFLYDYVVKSAALAKGPAMVEDITGPNLLTPVSDDLLRGVVTKERRTWALTKSGPGVRVPNEVAVPVAARIVDVWDTAQKEIRDNTPDAGFKALMEAVQGTMRMSSPVESPKDSKEEIIRG